MDEDRRRWDERHASTTGPASLIPARGLDDAGLRPRVPGRALDVACGVGGTAVWAAFDGLGVTVEHSAEGGGEATVVAVGPHDTPVDRVRPMDDKLRAVLDELQSTIRRSEADGVIDDDERNELRTLAERLDALLEEEREQDGLVDHLEESAIRFEGNHPTIAAAIRSAVHTLTGYGM